MTGRKKITGVTLILAAALGIGGTAAYLTSFDKLRIQWQQDIIQQI